MSLIQNTIRFLCKKEKYPRQCFPTRYFALDYLKTYFFLSQSGQGFFNPFHGLDNVFVTGGIAHTEAFGGSESVATHCSYMSHFKQVHGKVGGVVDYTFTVFLTEIRTALGEQIECRLPGCSPLIREFL